MNRLTLEEKKRANKIRCKLLYTIDRDLRESKKNNNNNKQMLINSMTLQEIENKFLLIQNYKMKLSNTFTKIANKYMVMKTVDNKTKKNFFYTDYLQDLKKETFSFVKLERKRISARNIINISYLVESQEQQSPIPELITNKMNIGEKKLRKSQKKDFFNKSNNSNIYYKNSNNMSNHNIMGLDIEKKNPGNDKVQSLLKKDKQKNNNYNNKNKINEDDSSSMNSLTLELILKKANYHSASVNKKNKKELKRRKIQFEAIRKLRNFCFQKLRNKKNKRFITKSSHSNILYINKKLNDEDEKNNSNLSLKNDLKNNIKDKNKNMKINSSKSGKKRSELQSDSKKKKNYFMKQSKEKKKMATININTNSWFRKQSRHNSSKKIPTKTKKITFQRNSLMERNNIISGKLEKDILRFHRKDKDKSKEKKSIQMNQFTPIEEDTSEKYTPNNDNNANKYTINNNNINISNQLPHKYSTKIKDKFYFKSRNSQNINQCPASNPLKLKNKSFGFNEYFKPSKKTFSTSNFSNKKNKTKKNIYSSANLVKVMKKYSSIKRENSKVDKKKRRRYSIPINISTNKLKTNLIAVNNFDIKKDNKEKKRQTLYNDKNNQIWNLGKIEINHIYKVDEEDY